MLANVLPILFKLLDVFPAPTEPTGTTGPGKSAEPIQPAPAALLLKNKAEEEGGQAAHPLPRKTAGSAAASRQALEAGRGEGSFARPEGSSPLFASASSSPQDTALLLPLALKSLHFLEASFYLVLNNPDERKRAGPKEKEGFTLLLVLKTANLGVLRIFFLHQGDDLRLSWLTQTETAKEYLKKGFPELEAELSGAGYASVIMDIRRLPEEAERENPHSHPRRKAQNHLFDLYI